MTRQRHIAILLLSLALLVSEAASHPGVFLAIGAPVGRVINWIADGMEHIVHPPTECPWNPECI